MADLAARMVPGPGVSDDLPPPHSLARSSSGLLVGKGAQMALGYAFWLVAAKVATASEVGLVSGALSGVMIVTQLALLGIGAAVILRIPSLQRREAMTLSDAALTMVALTALVGGIVYVLVMWSTSPHLRDLLAQPAEAALIVGACIAGTLGVCLDQISTALGRGGMVVPRGIAAGLVGVLGLVILANATELGPTAMMACWSSGLLASTVLGLAMLRRLLGHAPRPRLRHPESRGLLRDGIPNQALTLTERVPALLLPVLITGYVSPTLGGYWYPVWMMAWAVFLAPVMVGQAQFAADVRGTNDLGHDLRASLRWSMLMGGAVAVVMAVIAGELLALMGQGYTTHGTSALRVLLLALPGVAVLQAYSAVCRAHRRVREAIWLGAAVGTLACVTAVLAATTSDLLAVAWAWVAAQSLGGLVAGWRLRAMVVASRALT